MSKNSGAACCMKPSVSGGEITLFVVFALVITYVLIKTELFSGMGGVGSDAGLGAVALLGVVASVSTCLAMTGGFIVGAADILDTNKSTKGHVLFHGLVHIGRYVTFFVLGSLLGFLGETISLSLGFTLWTGIILSLVFLYLGCSILGIRFRFMKGISSKVHSLTDRFKVKNTKVMPLLVGALTFFIPCGFNQSVQFMALASGSALSGGLVMLFFALGTTPGLFALGMGTSYAKQYKKFGFEKGVAVMLLIFGFFTLRGNASMLGIQDRIVSAFQTTVQQEHASAPIEITLGHDGNGLVPKYSTLQAGETYTITIIPERDGVGCNRQIVLPVVDSTVYPVKQGVPITYTIENAQPGQLSFVCGSRGSNQGKITITG